MFEECIVKNWMQFYLSLSHNNIYINLFGNANSIRTICGRSVKYLGNNNRCSVEKSLQYKCNNWFCSQFEEQWLKTVKKCIDGNISSAILIGLLCSFYFRHFVHEEEITGKNPTLLHLALQPVWRILYL